MKPFRLPLRRTCKEVASILVAREDQDLRWFDRFALRMHLAVCDACPKFERQLLVMRNQMAQWRKYTETDAGER